MMGLLFLGLKERASLNFSQDMAQKMGNQIWYNECRGKIEGLTVWNEGEAFASLGIGHFIWSPEPFIMQQTFPSFLDFLRRQKVDVPIWLQEMRHCPWQSRQEFMRAQASPQMLQLKELLQNTVSLQVQFIVERLQRVLPKILRHAPDSKKKHIVFQFRRLAKHEAGRFALLDYTNFKGEGFCCPERGWGVVCVLASMQGSLPDKATAEFVEVAKSLLNRRVELSDGQEKRFLKGWHNRLDTYLKFGQ
jgi:hypothetical protein